MALYCTVSPTKEISSSKNPRLPILLLVDSMLCSLCLCRVCSATSTAITVTHQFRVFDDCFESWQVRVSVWGNNDIQIYNQTGDASGFRAGVWVWVSAGAQNGGLVIVPANFRNMEIKWVHFSSANSRQPFQFLYSHSMCSMGPIGHRDKCGSNSKPSRGLFTVYIMFCSLQCGTEHQVFYSDFGLDCLTCV